LYLAYLRFLLFWMLDRSSSQRATFALLAIVRRALPLPGIALRLGRVRSLVRDLDAQVQAGLFSED